MNNVKPPSMTSVKGDPEGCSWLAEKKSEKKQEKEEEEGGYFQSGEQEPEAGWLKKQQLWCELK